MTLDRPRLYKTEALVLKQTPLGEADRLLVLLTPYHGKLRAVARGVRRPTSKLGGNVELLTRSQMSLARGRNLDVITQSQIVESFPGLRRDLWRTCCALYAAELVEGFAPEDLENPGLYDLFLQTLRRLEESKHTGLALRFLEVRLLDLLGYGPELYQCVACGKAVEPVPQGFSPAGGGVLCPRCLPREALGRPLSVNALKVLRLLQGAPYATASRLRLSEELAAELELTLRQQLSYLLERGLKSLAFLELLKRDAGGRELLARAGL